MRYTIALIVLTLAGCQSAPKLPEPPEIVEVEVVRYVPVPAELTKPCAKFVAREQTYDEAKRLALLRGEAAEECDSRMTKIRNLPATPTK